MSARSAGHVLLALAVLGAAGVAWLAVTHGSADWVLVAIASGAVLAGVLVVLGDVRRQRRGGRSASL